MLRFLSSTCWVFLVILCLFIVSRNHGVVALLTFQQRQHHPKSLLQRMMTKNPPSKDDNDTPNSGNSQQQQQQSSSSVLVPEENPEAILVETSTSQAGVLYKSVFDGLQILYPPQKLEQRNAESRTDGYWKYINNGQEPPQQFTYGEFDFYFFAQLLDKALEYSSCGVGDDDDEDDDDAPPTWEDKVFVDIGSGTGRLVLAAAALHSWKTCRGLEILPGITNFARDTLETCQKIKMTPNEENDDDNDDDDDDDDDDDEDEVWVPMGSSSFDSSSMWLTELQNQFVEDDNNNDNEEDVSQDNDRQEIDNTVSSVTGTGEEGIVHKDDNDVETSTSAFEEMEVEFYLPTDSTEEEEEEHAESSVKLSPIEFSCGSFDDPYEYFGDADCIFVFSSCMSQDLMGNLGKAIGRQCQEGTIVITTEFMLPLEATIEPMEFDPDMPSGTYQFELLEKIDGYCWLVGGQSTAYIHRITKSLGREYGSNRIKPFSEEQIAYEAIQYMKDNKSQRTKTFLTQVRNNMVYHGFPDNWLPILP